MKVTFAALQEAGLGSLCFAGIVARLEDNQGLDSITASEDVSLPVILGEFVKFYEGQPDLSQNRTPQTPQIGHFGRSAMRTGKSKAGGSARAARAFAKRFINHRRLDLGEPAAEPFMRTEAIAAHSDCEADALPHAVAVTAGYSRAFFAAIRQSLWAVQ